MAPCVSVVIATYNYGRFLGRALDSVLTQTFSDYEVIVVDDGSTDDTPSVIKPYLEGHPISYHRVEHIGVSAAKNHGMRQVRGRYVAFLDSDDQWAAEKLERQLSLFGSDPTTGLVYTRRMVIDPEDRFLRVDQGQLHRGNVLNQLFLNNFVCYSSAMVRREVLNKVGLLDESIVIPSDFDLWLRIALHYRFDYLDEPLTLYREHPGISRKKTVFEIRPEIDFVKDRFLNEYGGKSAIEPQVLRLCELNRLCNLGWAYRSVSPIRSIGCYMKALRNAPLHWPAWLGLVAALIPERGRCLLRRPRPSPASLQR